MSEKGFNGVVWENGKMTPNVLHYNKINFRADFVKDVFKHFTPAEHAEKLFSMLQSAYWFNFNTEEELQNFVNDVISHKRKNPELKFRDCCEELGAIA